MLIRNKRPLYFKAACSLLKARKGLMETISRERFSAGKIEAM